MNIIYQVFSPPPENTWLRTASEGSRAVDYLYGDFVWKFVSLHQKIIFKFHQCCERTVVNTSLYSVTCYFFVLAIYFLCVNVFTYYNKKVCTYTRSVRFTCLFLLFFLFLLCIICSFLSSLLFVMHCITCTL